jgi:ABC-type antimicrobial peptide transport system permease subunit
MTQLLIRCMEIIFLKLVAIIFGLILGNLFFWGTYFCFILISWGCLTSPTFFFLQYVILIGPSQKNKKVETIEARCISIA